MTYPDSEVIAFLNAHYVVIRVNTEAPTSEGRRLLAKYRLLWEPGFVFLDHRGTEIRRAVGYRPPHEFLAELRLVLGKIAMLYGDNAGAVPLLRAAADTTPPPACAPEALYFAGIAVYRREGRDRVALKAQWDELRRRFVDSLWWVSADVFPPS